jgi:hypothetical protein
MSVNSDGVKAGFFEFHFLGFWLLAASCQSLVASSQSSIAKFTTFATQ